jgi:hypothetical protein
MRRFTSAAVVVLTAALFPVLAPAASNMSMSTVGAGPNGYDWYVGTWTCKNTMAPSKLGGLSSSTFTATKLKDGSIFIHSASPNGDVTAYLAYVPKTKTWYAPFSDSGGNYGYESSQQSGKTIQSVGTFYGTSGDPTPIRDTYIMLNMRTQYDLSEAKIGGAWKTTAKTTCTKS